MSQLNNGLLVKAFEWRNEVLLKLFSKYGFFAITGLNESNSVGEANLI